jgi:hypothetical protein
MKSIICKTCIETNKKAAAKGERIPLWRQLLCCNGRQKREGFKKKLQKKPVAALLTNNPYYRQND